MSLSWQVLTAISVLGLSVSILLQRILLHKHKTDPVAYSAVFQAITAIIIGFFAMYHGFSLRGIETVWLISIVCIILYGIGTVVYAKTLQYVEASAFSVLFATHAVWVMILGILLFNESLTVLQIIGTILIFSSVMLLVKNIRTLSLDKGTAYGLMTGLIYGGAITSWAYVGRHIDTLSWAVFSFAGSALVSFLVKPSSASKIMPMLKSAVMPKMLLLGLFYAIGSAAMLFAYKYGSLTLVSPLRQSGIIVTVLLALVFLKSERNRIARKLIAATICSIGIVLVVI